MKTQPLTEPDMSAGHAPAEPSPSLFARLAAALGRLIDEALAPPSEEWLLRDPPA